MAIALTITSTTLSFAEAFQAGEGSDLQQTRNGFVALRKKPSVNSFRIRKLDASYHRVYPNKRNAKWVYVEVFTPDDYNASSNQNFNGAGYSRSDLINWNTCSNAG